MYNWVVKVVPQIPQLPDADGPRTPKKGRRGKKGESQAQSGVLGWLSNEFVGSMPQPNGSPRIRAKSISRDKSGEDESGGMIGWVTQGLANAATKVLPWSDTNNYNPEEHTEVYNIKEIPDYDPLPHIPVVEVMSDDELEIEALTQIPAKMANWLKQAIPQPVPPGAVPHRSRSARSSLGKIRSTPPESLSGISLDTDGKESGMVGWFVSGLGLKMPQPVIKDEAHDRKRGSVPPTPKKQQKQSTSSPMSGRASAPESPRSVTKTSQEDAETQTGRWTPFLDSIKKEAQGVALATMEERLLQDRIEMVRMAEDVARKTAENAIREMTADGQSLKLSLGSQELLESEAE